MNAQYLVAGSHPDTLASGRPIAPGDTVPAEAVDLKDPHDQALLDSGVLIDVDADREQAASAAEGSSSTDGTSARSGDAPASRKKPQTGDSSTAASPDNAQEG